ncbi:MAG: hypothetical protein JRH10_00650 [Deltaproteobacteria bacterium]|nr:hypothetical protein [Deltaproteobacteria bacterium]MBW2447215.1 hypothetical protein [Deltaproteobacteria bacterium]
MTRHRRLRLLGFTLAAAVAWAVAPGSASAEDHRDHRRHDVRGDDRDHDRGDRNHDRGDRNRDRLERRDRERDHRAREGRRDDHRRFDRDRGERDRLAKRAPWHRYGRHDRNHQDARRYDSKKGHHRQGYDRYRHGSDRYSADRHRFHRHERRTGGSPFWCADHRRGFNDRRYFDDHLVRFHFVAPWRLSALVAHLGFGWTYGH